MIDEIDSSDDNGRKFHEMGLDDRLLKAIAKLGWISPTLIQEKAIPLILDGKDVLVKARTGSGKTGAFALPIIQKILTTKEGGVDVQGVQALILAPSKELSRQIYNHIQQLIIKCSNDIRVVDISPQVDVDVQKAVLCNPPEVIVSTPGRAVIHLQRKSFTIDNLKVLVIDEADLIFSFGHEEDIKTVMRFLPRVYQAVLASATLTDEVSSLKGLLLHNCVSLKLQEPNIAPIVQLVHYSFFAEESEKAVVLYALFKLGLVQGRSIVFVNTVNKCYRLKLFLQHFEVPSCVLNSELPAVSRIHALSQFNDGKYDIIITSDETDSLNSSNDKPSSKYRGLPKDKESGVSRGIDFRDVSNVINFDFPKSVNSYIHRVGRTARGTAKGAAISLINVLEKPMMDEVNSYLSEGLALRDSSIFKDFQFNMSEVEGLQYRVKEAWRVVTRKAVKETRLAEIRQEIFNSKKLKHYFKDNPKDLETLRHDKASHVVKLPGHVANVPEYLVPPSLQGVPGLIRKRKKAKLPSKASGLTHSKYKAKVDDPLFNYDILENNDQPEEFEEKPKRRKKFVPKWKKKN